MKIYHEIYGKILENQNERPPETGGILGAINGVIAKVYFDLGMQTETMCSYIPNIKNLNTIIENWQNEKIIFSGIFHTHFWGVKTLSATDKEYIYKIMKNMPNEIRSLHFPLIVMPQKQMICYRAVFVNEKLAIEIEDLEIKDGGTYDEKRAENKN